MEDRTDRPAIRRVDRWSSGRDYSTWPVGSASTPCRRAWPRAGVGHRRTRVPLVVVIVGVLETDAPDEERIETALDLDPLWWTPDSGGDPEKGGPCGSSSEVSRGVPS